MAGPWNRSLWDADPLSWFTTPNLPLAAAGLTLINGVIVLGPAAQGGSQPWVQAGALILAVLASLWVHVVTRPSRGPLTVPRTAVAVILSGSAVVLSALGYRGEIFSLELWWAPLSMSLLLFALAPYSSVLRLAVVGVVLLTMSSATIVLFVVPDDATWPPFSTVLITTFPILAGMLGGVVMIRVITATLARWNERPLDVSTAGQGDDDLVIAVDALTSARIADATAFIASILDRGRVTQGDTLRAAAIAERLRGELTGEVDRTWLERVAEGRAVTIDDTDDLLHGLGSTLGG